MEGGKEGKSRRYQEGISVTKKTHEPSNKSNKSRQFPKGMLYIELFSNITTEANSLVSKKYCLLLGENAAYKSSVHILSIYSYEIVQLYSYIVHSGISFQMLQLHTFAEQ
jgi:hypothetical protein